MTKALIAYIIALLIVLTVVLIFWPPPAGWELIKSLLAGPC